MKGKASHIPVPAVRRLSLYLRQLEAFHDSGRKTVSSLQLGEPLSLSDAQVRKDLAYFGQFGHPGIGYRVPELISKVRRILGTDKRINVAVVGVGNLGRALIAFRGFQKYGFAVVAAFDKDPAKIGKPPALGSDIIVSPLEELRTEVRARGIRIGILAVPAAAAQSAAEAMVAAGIGGILNFAPVPLQIPEGTAVSSVDLGVHLEQLTFQLNGGMK